jgi:hypothetical protein
MLSSSLQGRLNRCRPLDIFLTKGYANAKDLDGLTATIDSCRSSSSSSSSRLPLRTQQGIYLSFASQLAAPAKVLDQPQHHPSRKISAEIYQGVMPPTLLPHLSYLRKIQLRYWRRD